MPDQQEPVCQEPNDPEMAPGPPCGVCGEPQYEPLTPWKSNFHDAEDGHEWEPAQSPQEGSGDGLTPADWQRVTQWVSEAAQMLNAIKPEPPISDPVQEALSWSPVTGMAGSSMGEPTTTKERIEFEMREAERWGLPLAEYLIMRLDHVRDIASDNAQEGSKANDYKMALDDEQRLRLATVALYEREREIRLDYENLCAGLICPTCGFEPIKVGHGGDY